MPKGKKNQFLRNLQKNYVLLYNSTRIVEGMPDDRNNGINKPTDNQSSLQIN